MGIILFLTHGIAGTEFKVIKIYQAFVLCQMLG